MPITTVSQPVPVVPPATGRSRRTGFSAARVVPGLKREDAVGGLEGMLGLGVGGGGGGGSASGGMGR